MAAHVSSEWPRGLAAPARRALSAAGLTRLEQLSKLREEEVLSLHGMGPSAIDMLRKALAARGMALADGGRS